MVYSVYVVQCVYISIKIFFFVSNSLSFITFLKIDAN